MGVNPKFASDSGSNPENEVLDFMEKFGWQLEL